MKKLLELFNNHPLSKEIRETITTKGRLELTDTNEAINMVLIAYLNATLKRPVLVVNHNLYHAQRLYERFPKQENNTFFFPQDEFITTDMLAMSESFKLERLSTISGLMNESNPIVFTHPTGLLKKLWPLKLFKEATRTYCVNDTVDIEQFTRDLVRLGYTYAHGVEKPGEFARRGSLIDIYLPQYDHPIRLDFFDDELDSIRVFDVSTQRSIEKIKEFTLMPRVEFFYTEDHLNEIKHTLEEKRKMKEYTQETLNRIDEEYEQLFHFSNQDKLARYMSFTKETLETIGDYLNEPVVVYINSEGIKKANEQIVSDLTDWVLESGDYPSLGFDFIHDLDRLFQPTLVYLNTFKDTPKNVVTKSIRAKEAMQYDNNMHILLKDLKKYHGHVSVVIALSTEKRVNKFIELLDEYLVPFQRIGSKDNFFEKAINVVHDASLPALEWFDLKLIVLNDQAIYKETTFKKQKYKSVLKDTKKVSHVKELAKGDYVVHYDHGIGRFLGIETVSLQTTTNDYIVIKYKGDDTLYIPIENIHLIQKYVAHEGIMPKMHKLGGAEWAKTKTRVRKKARDIADKLLKLYAQREQAKGFAYSEDVDLMNEFEADFMFEETPDQLQAIADVKKDMESTMPMDRLLCGDVGYGKTEVALRAAFKAVLDNKQVAYLAPTTVLSRQHFYTFKDRMKKHGIHVALLNRFVTPAKQKHAIDGLLDGSVDIIIGTHRLLSKDIVYKDLGLLIIDEEQRFGVEHKERIKEFKANIDVLSLSATPIPRTLQMAMTGVKQMSVLETPPKNRLPIQTYVLKRSEHVIKDAIERELARNGQIFYLYNRVEDIERIQENLIRLVPDARVVHAHGQMNRNTLEQVITDFLDKKFDVLVSTTIIETGIDIPNANTLIVHDADRLGLSQLYQIRGRVGRSDRIAYSYLMYAKNKVLNEDASKRLQVIKEFTELGSGYKIAMRDLAIRGAGDLLGAEQSGFIESVGIDLFLAMIKEEIEKGKDTEAILNFDPKKDEAKKQALKRNISRTIPKEYIEDDDIRIEMHRRILDLENSTDVLLLKEECVDRFGKMPEAMQLYMMEKLYEKLALIHDVEKVKESTTRIEFILSKEKSSAIYGDILFAKVTELSKFIRLDYKQSKLHIIMDKLKLEKPVPMMIVPILETL